MMQRRVSNGANPLKHADDRAALEKPRDRTDLRCRLNGENYSNFSGASMSPSEKNPCGLDATSAP